MTTISFQFSGYPTLVNGHPILVNGLAQITLRERLGLPVQVNGIAPEKPLQRAIRWKINHIFLDRLVDSDHTTDSERFVRCRHWPQIDRLLYAAFLAEVGLHEHAQVYTQLCEGVRQ